MTSPIAPATAGTSTRPYLIRALHDWCTDNGFTPYIAVFVDEHVQVPKEYVKNNEIVLNVGFEATSALKLGNETDRVQGALRRHLARDRGADRPRDRDLRARERPGHGVPDAERRQPPATGGDGRSRSPARAARAAPGRRAAAAARKGGTALTPSRRTTRRRRASRRARSGRRSSA